MYAFEQQIRVRLAFPAMTEPVEVSVPWGALRYLDLHGDRAFDLDGCVVYVQRARAPRLDERAPGLAELVLAGA